MALILDPPVEFPKNWSAASDRTGTLRRGWSFCLAPLGRLRGRQPERSFGSDVRPVKRPIRGRGCLALTVSVRPSLSHPGAADGPPPTMPEVLGSLVKRRLPMPRGSHRGPAALDRVTLVHREKTGDAPVSWLILIRLHSRTTDRTTDLAHYRRGHYRRSPNGGYHYVQPHTVSRGSGGRSSRSSGGGGSWSPRPVEHVWVHPMPLEPNATCPVCGARVYFWKNKAGSKVWFDALGRPWPKHPCLDIVHATSSEHRAYIEHARLNTNPNLPAPQRVPARTPIAGAVFLAFLLTCCPGSILGAVVGSVAGEDSATYDAAVAMLAVAMLVVPLVVFVWMLGTRLSPHAEADEALKLARRLTR